MVTNFFRAKKAWIKLMEVFISIVLIGGVILIVPNIESGKKMQREEIISKEMAILHDLQLNDTLRAEILAVGSLPLDWQSFESSLPKTQRRITDLSPSNYKCEARVCALDDLCISEINSKNSVYAQAIVISANSTTYSPRQLKLFCSQKE